MLTRTFSLAELAALGLLADDRPHVPFPYIEGMVPVTPLDAPGCRILFRLTGPLGGYTEPVLMTTMLRFQFYDQDERESWLCFLGVLHWARGWSKGPGQRDDTVTAKLQRLESRAQTRWWPAD